MKQRNLEIRQKVKASGVRYWQIAEKLGISAETLCIWLRKELDDKTKQRALSAIDEIKKECEDDDEV